MTLTARDHGVQIDADASRVVARLFLPGETIGPSRSRVDVIAGRVNALPQESADRIAKQIVADFSSRHTNLSGILDDHARSGIATIGGEVPDNAARRTVLGASFTSEYAVEGAALCNPSPTVHPDQTGLQPGQLRVALSLREIGEGHVSVLGFASAIIGPGEDWVFEERQHPLETATVTQADATWASYHATFAHGSELSRRVIQPVIAEEKNGIEDARIVQVIGDDGSLEYRATYTAYDGHRVVPRLLVSKDLVTFTSHRLTGPAATNKGVALFPRRVKGELLALVRSDGETNSIATSVDGLDWQRETAIMPPRSEWELVQSGNCGSPIETPEGWLVMTHGVGPMRVYTMSAMLLDLDDPTKVIGSLDGPLLKSDGARQNGYVPNVVYSCGSILHDGIVWIPFGVGDNRIRIASIGLDELLAAMVRE